MFAGISVSQSLCSWEYLVIRMLDKDSSSCACNKEPQSFLLSQRQRFHRRFQYWDSSEMWNTLSVSRKCFDPKTVQKGERELNPSMHNSLLLGWKKCDQLLQALASFFLPCRVWTWTGSQNEPIHPKVALSDKRSNWDKWVQDNRGKLISFHWCKEKEINRTWLRLLW